MCWHIDVVTPEQDIFLFRNDNVHLLSEQEDLAIPDSKDLLPPEEYVLVAECEDCPSSDVADVFLSKEGFLLYHQRAGD